MHRLDWWRRRSGGFVVVCMRMLGWRVLRDEVFLGGGGMGEG